MALKYLITMAALDSLLHYYMIITFFSTYLFAATGEHVNTVTTVQIFAHGQKQLRVILCRLLIKVPLLQGCQTHSGGKI